MEHAEKMAEEQLNKRRQRARDRYHILTQKYQVPAAMAKKAKEWSADKIWNVLRLQVRWEEDMRWLEKNREDKGDATD